MTRKTILTLIVLAVILGIIFLVQKAVRDEDEGNNAVLSVAAYNQTKGNDASTAAANPGNIIVYTLTAENNSDKIIRGYVFEANIADITELATLTDATGANYNSSSNSLVWTPLDIPENGSLEKKFSVRVKDELPANSDLSMSMKFNNEVKVAVAKTVVAGVSTESNGRAGSAPGESKTAPKAGIPAGIVLVLAIACTLGVFLFRMAYNIRTS